MKLLNSRFYGQAGEYYALFRLWETGITAVLAPPGARRVDLLLYDGNYELLATVQVKTRSTKDEKVWLLSRKQVEHSREDHFYIFVELDLHPKGIPTSYVVPSAVVAELGRRAIADGPGLAASVRQELRLASKNPRFLNFVVLKPILEKPDLVLGDNWTWRFDNAYEIITEPLFRRAANDLLNRQNHGS
jgi:hypothetical protein